MTTWKSARGEKDEVQLAQSLQSEIGEWGSEGAFSVWNSAVSGVLADLNRKRERLLDKFLRSTDPFEQMTLKKELDLLRRSEEINRGLLSKAHDFLEKCRGHYEDFRRDRY